MFRHHVSWNQIFFVHFVRALVRAGYSSEHSYRKWDISSARSLEKKKYDTRLANLDAILIRGTQYNPCRSYHKHSQSGHIVGTGHNSWLHHWDFFSLCDCFQLALKDGFMLVYQAATRDELKKKTQTNGACFLTLTNPQWDVCQTAVGFEWVTYDATLHVNVSISDDCTCDEWLEHILSIKPPPLPPLILSRLSLGVLCKMLMMISLCYAVHCDVLRLYLLNMCCADCVEVVELFIFESPGNPF